MSRFSLALLGCLLSFSALAAAPPEGPSHWSLRPRSRPPVPQLAAAAHRAWVRTPVDAFVLSRLLQEGLAPAPEADRRTLIRRLSFDLLGLPPTPEEVAAFVRDPAPDAYERLVERLLASPHYGEHWGRHWLDVVRYAETEGFEYDRHRPGAWEYRDYVIRAFNQDRPYDQFLREQLAGDEIDPGNRELLVAAGFHRLGPVRRNAGNQLVAFSRHEVLTEMTDAVGAVFLGLTIGCARCHDHKFDDIPQADYFHLQAYLAATHEHDHVEAPPAVLAEWKATTERIKAEVKRLREAAERADGEARRQLEQKIREAEHRLPPSLPTVSTVQHVEAERTPIHLLKRGDPAHPGPRVGPRALSALLPASAPELPPDAPRPRTELARWLTDPGHPLVARVLVNRVWQFHFGRGLVETPNDFGANGSLPSHPELLDHLAGALVDGGWRLKPMHRLLVLSSTYRQASRAVDPRPGMQKDPEGRLLWRFPRRRLTAEELRDAMLAVAGRLQRKAGGPSVLVPVDDDLVKLLYDPGQWKVTPDLAEHDRRSVYLLAKRNLRLPFVEVFDQPDAQTPCACRESSTHAGQALELLNGKLATRLAEALAQRLQHEAGPDPGQQVERAYQLAAGRPPSAHEKALALAFLQTHPPREFALAVLNLNAFLYVD